MDNFERLSRSWDGDHHPLTKEEKLLRGGLTKEDSWQKMIEEKRDWLRIGGSEPPATSCQ